MPLFHEPKQLQFYSMISIARNFNLIFFKCKEKGDMGELLKDDSFLTFEGPYLKLPVSLCSSLQEILRNEKGYLRRQHLHILVQPYQIDFSFDYVGDKFYALDILQNRCSYLQKLDLCYTRTINPFLLMKLIMSLPNLINLNLKMTSTCDGVMDHIGRCCTQLQSLDISMCNVTNRGIRRLCYDDVNKIGRCQKLVKLSATECMATSQSIWFLLHKIKSLRELEFENIFQTFTLDNIMAYQIEDRTKREPFKLMSLTATDEYVSSSTSEMAVALCPQTTNITISNCPVDAEIFESIANLEYLKHLRITNTDNEAIGFYDAILPILSVKGFQLETLVLSKFTTVDLDAVGQLCPNLKNLALSNIVIYEELLYPRGNYFNKLNSLEIWTNPAQDPVLPLILKQLLFFCQEIKSILLSGSNFLTDRLYQELQQNNGMKKLQRITIENCVNVSDALVNNILFSENAVHLIRIWTCYKFTEETEKNIKQLIKKHNFDVYFEWYG